MDAHDDGTAAAGAPPPSPADVRAVHDQLLRTGGADVAGVASALRLPAPDVRTALDVLAAQGLARHEEGGEHRYAPVRPDTAQSAALLADQQRLLVEQQRLEERRRELSRQVELYEQGVRRRSDSLPIERIEGSSTPERIMQIVESARSETLTIMRNLQDEGTLAEDTERDLASLAAGMRLRAILPSEVLDRPAHLASSLTTIAAGDQQRLLPEPPISLLVLDRHTVLVPLDPSVPRAGAMAIRSEPVVEAFTLLFEALFSLADPLLPDPLPADPAQHATHREDRTRQVLGLLAAGVGDEAIARSLGLGLRTVRRVISEVSDELGARTRFQAGVLAAKRGLL